MAPSTRPYGEALLAALGDPDEAEHYLDAARDESPESLAKAQRNVAEAKAAQNDKGGRGVL